MVHQINVWMAVGMWWPAQPLLTIRRCVIGRRRRPRGCGLRHRKLGGRLVYLEGGPKEGGGVRGGGVGGCAAQKSCRSQIEAGKRR